VFDLRINWRLKALLPLALVLVAGIFLFTAATVELAETQRKSVLLIASVGALAIGAVLLLVLAVLVHQPLVELQDCMRRFRGGDWEVAVQFAERNDEIGDLGRDFNELVSQLRRKHDEVEQLHRTQISRAEHLAAMGEMAAGVAHEIRNPLAGIDGVLEVVRRDLPKNSPAQEVLADVLSEVKRVNRIVGDLLHCARPKNPEFRVGDLNHTVMHAAAVARQQPLAKNVDLEVIPCDNLWSVEHDEWQMHQALLNLLLNALQAMPPEGGKLRVEVGMRGGFATVTIADNGKGIDPDHLPHIFRPFFTTKRAGTGLGLSLVQRVIDLHGGDVQVESEPGKGTQFSISLPFRRPAADETEEAAVTAELVS
jgi:signal transduction histidine kinase